MGEEHSKARGLLVVAGVFAASLMVLWYGAQRDRELAEKARQEAAAQKAASIEARRAAANTPEAIEKRKHDAQLAALELADAKDKKRAATAAAERACRADPACWYRRHDLDADVRCRQAVERLAQYQFDWTDSVFGKRKFERAAWADQTAGSLMLMGSAIKMQNGFGAWRNMSYRCIYSTGTGRATAFAD